MSRRHIESLAALALAALAATGCVDNRSSIEILGRAAPGDVASCLYTGGGQFLLGNGVIDVAGGTTYDTVLYVTNMMADPSKSGNGSTLSGKAWRATAARIRLNPSDFTTKYPPNPPLLPVQADVRVPLDGTTIDPAAKGVQALNVIPAAVGALLVAAGPGTVVAGVTLEGITLDGLKLDSAEYYFGLEVCNGCLACGAGLSRDSCFGPWQDPAGPCK